MKMKIVRYGIPAVYVLGLAVLQWYCCFYTARSNLLFLSVFLELFAVLLYLGFVSGVQKIVRYFHVKRNGIAKTAVIKRHRKVWGYRTWYYYLIFAYQGRDKQMHRVQSEECFLFIRRKYRVGKKLRIAYLPDDPDHPIIIPLSFFDVIPATLFVGVIAVWTAIGSFLLVLPS